MSHNGYKGEMTMMTCQVQKLDQLDIHHKNPIYSPFMFVISCLLLFFFKELYVCYLKKINYPIMLFFKENYGIMFFLRNYGIMFVCFFYKYYVCYIDVLKNIVVKYLYILVNIDRHQILQKNRQAPNINVIVYPFYVTLIIRE